MTTVTRRYEWDMGHRLPNHGGKCRRLHGHRYVAEVEASGPVAEPGMGNPSEGMVVDFGLLDRLAETTFLESWDHRTMLWKEDEFGERLAETPDEAARAGVIFSQFVPTAENIARDIMERFRKALAGPVYYPWEVVRVRVYETPNGWAEVRVWRA